MSYVITVFPVPNADDKTTPEHLEDFTHKSAFEDWQDAGERLEYLFEMKTTFLSSNKVNFDRFIQNSRNTSSGRSLIFFIGTGQFKRNVRMTLEIE